MKLQCCMGCFIFAVLVSIPVPEIRAEDPEKAFQEKMLADIEEEENRRVLRNWEVRRYLDPTRGDVRGRFGVVSPRNPGKRIERENSRFNRSAKFGADGSFLGVDRNDPSYRFKPRSLEPSRPVYPSQYLPEGPVATSVPIESVNIPVQGATPSSVATTSTPPVPTPATASEPALQIPEDISVLTPIEQRWFRDIGRHPGSGPGEPENHRPSGGPASMVGGVPQRPGPETNFRATPENPAAVRATNLRRLEQRLESMLLTDQSIYFLSPVQISYQNGTVTVKGIVENQQQKVTAGQLLLKDPAVSQVNNLISVFSTDPAKQPAPVELEK